MPHKLRIGAWELHHNVLRPSHCLLQSHNTLLLNNPPNLITFHLTGNPPTTNPPSTTSTSSIAVPRPLLIEAGGPLRALVSGPFAESSQSSITIHETLSTFQHVHRFLTRQPLCLDSVTPDLALVADRWGLNTLFEALFLHGEQQATPINSSSLSYTGMMIVKFLPIMALVDVPERFKRFLAMRLALDLIEVDKFFETCNERANMDDICNIQHEPGVACRRRKVDCVPVETADGVSAVPTKKGLMDEEGNLCEESQSIVLPDSTTDKATLGDSMWDGHLSRGEAVTESASAIAGEASAATANGIHTGQVGNAEEAVRSNDQGETSGQLNVSMEEDDHAGSKGKDVAEVAEHMVNVTVGNREQEGAASSDAQEEEQAEQNAEEEQDVNGEVEGEDGVQNEGIVQIEGAEHNETSGENEEDGDDLEVLPEPCVPPPPYPTERKAWHKEFDIWRVFQQQKMMRLFIHYLSDYGGLDYGMFLMDVVLAQLEPTLDNDEEVIELLRQIDWYWEMPTCEMLTSDVTASWSPRAWRLLALAQLHYKQTGVNIRMNWTYHNLFNDIRERAAQLANKNDDSDANSSNSSDDEHDPGFSAEWNGRAGDQGFEFGMSLQCLDPDPDEITPLNMTIRLLERNDEVLDKRTGRREVTVRIKVIECGCGCALGDEDEFQGFTASPTRNAEERVVDLKSFKDRGNTYKIMESDQFGLWIKRHTPQCGLVFQVRLYIFPPLEKERKREDSVGEGRKFKCLCGFCNCDGCDESD